MNKWRAKRAEALYEVSQALTGTLDLDQVLGLISEQAARLLGFDSAQVLLRQPDGSLARLGAFGAPGDAGAEAGPVGPDALEPARRALETDRGACVVTLYQAA